MTLIDVVVLADWVWHDDDDGGAGGGDCGGYGDDECGRGLVIYVVVHRVCGAYDSGSDDTHLQQIRREKLTVFWVNRIYIVILLQLLHSFV